MALIQCPECRKTLSDQAEKCPDCGYPIKPLSKPKNEEPIIVNNNAKEGCFLQTLNVGCVIVVIVVIVIALALFVGC